MSKLIPDSTITISATSTAVSATMFGAADANRLLISNLGPNYAYFDTSTSAITAQTNDPVVPPYESFWVQHDPRKTIISVVCDSGMTAIFKVTEGYEGKGS